MKNTNGSCPARTHWCWLHAGTGHVVTVDPSTGVGTLFGTFMDPSTHKGVSFAGAGVSSLVPIIK